MNAAVVTSIASGFMLALSGGLLVHSEKEKHGRRKYLALLILNISAALVGVATAYVGSIEGERGEKRASDLQATVTAQKAAIEAQGVNIIRLRDDLAPFLEVASKRFPASSPSSALKGLEKELGDLAGRTTALEIRSSGRHLSAAAMERMASGLRAACPLEVEVSAFYDSESRQFASDLQRAIDRAGCKSIGITNIPDLSPMHGVQVILPLRPERPNGTNELIAALRSAGIRPMVLTGDGPGPDGIELRIGSK